MLSNKQQVVQKIKSKQDIASNLIFVIDKMLSLIYNKFNKLYNNMNYKHLRRNIGGIIL